MFKSACPVLLFFSFVYFFLEKSTCMLVVLCNMSFVELNTELEEKSNLFLTICEDITRLQSSDVALLLSDIRRLERECSALCAEKLLIAEQTYQMACPVPFSSSSFLVFRSKRECISPSPLLSFFHILFKFLFFFELLHVLFSDLSIFSWIYCDLF